MASVLVSLAACSGGGGTTFSTAADLAKAAGCSSFQGGSTQMYVKDGGQCQVDGQTVYVYVFSASSDRDNWVTVARKMQPGVAVGEGTQWVTTGLDSGSVTKATKAAGEAVL